VLIAGVGVEALDETLHHGAQIAGGIHPMPVGGKFKRGAIKIEAAEIVRKALAIVLVPDDGPLREEIGRVGVAGVVGDGPGEELALGVELDGAAGDGGFVHRGGDWERLLPGKGAIHGGAQEDDD